MIRHCLKSLWDNVELPPQAFPANTRLSCSLSTHTPFAQPSLHSTSFFDHFSMSYYRRRLIHPKYTYFLPKQLGNITPATINRFTATKYVLTKYQKKDTTKPNTSKPHPNLKTHPKLYNKPKHKYHAKYSTSTLNINKNHNKLKRARPTGLANIENKKQKKIKEKNNKTKTYQKTTINTPSHRPSNTSYQQRPVNSITPSPMRLEILLYFSNTNIYAALQPQYTSYAKKNIPSKNKETRPHPSIIYKPTTKSVL